MNNSGDFITVYDSNNISVLTFDVEPLSNNPNESYTRILILLENLNNMLEYLKLMGHCFHLERE